MTDRPRITRCETCNEAGELRPYGPGGSLICFDCAFATPETTAQTEAAFHTQIEAAEAMSDVGVTLIGGESGPEPLMKDDLQ